MLRLRLQFQFQLQTPHSHPCLRPRSPAPARAAPRWVTPPSSRAAQRCSRSVPGAEPVRRRSWGRRRASARIRPLRLRSVRPRVRRR
ncbi:hypothetical protein ACFPRL_10245 [Pseudoclavibacter helvolus]